MTINELWNKGPDEDMNKHLDSMGTSCCQDCGTTYTKRDGHSCSPAAQTTQSLLSMMKDSA